MLSEIEVEEILFNKFPEFYSYWKKEEEEIWGPDHGFSAFIASFSNYIQDSILNNTIKNKEIIEKAFELAEELMTKGEDSVQNAIATCFLENLINATTSEREPVPASTFVHLLGPESIAYCKAWDEFTGVKTEGLWEDEFTPENSLAFKNVKALNEDYSKKVLKRFLSENSSFEGCKFEGIKVEDMCFGAGKTMSTYINCSFDRSEFSSKVGLARFVNCTFLDVNIHKFLATNAEFINCTFSGKLSSTVFHHKIFCEDVEWIGRDTNEFIGKDFSHLEMKDVDFRSGIDLNKQNLPNGSNYLFIKNAEEFLNKFEKKIKYLNNPLVQERADNEWKIAKQQFAYGQKQLFIIKEDIMPEIFDAMNEVENS